MGFLRNVPVKTKLLLISMISSTVALILAGTALVVYDRAAVKRKTVEESSVLATVVGDRSNAALLFGDEAQASENLDALAAREAVAAGCIYRRGRLFASYSRSGSETACDTTVPADGIRFDSGAFHLTQAIEADGERIGTIYLRTSLEELEDRGRRFTLLVGGVVVLAAFVAFAFSTGLQRIVSGPLHHLAATAQAISQEKDYSLRATKESEDELGVLVDAFNGMVSTVEQQNRAVVAANVELEGRNAELERFTYTVSHDLKTPLITLTGYAGLLERDVASGRGEKVETDLKFIREAADQMGRLLDELLELSRVGRVMNDPEDVPMEELIREAVRRVGAVICERGVTVEVATGLPVVHGDRMRLVEVLQNLVENAVRFMGEEKEPKIEIASRNRGGERVFYVRDNGIGIDARYHEKVFGLFERLDASVEGTGIGLAIVKRIIEVHGGRIWVESEGDGLGSTFCFTLPERKTAETIQEVSP